MSEHGRRITRRVEELEALDVHGDIAGSEQHGYEQDPIVQVQEIAAWEVEHDLRLPTEYREYLVEVAGGGAGPGFGLIGFPPEVASGDDRLARTFRLHRPCWNESEFPGHEEGRFETVPLGGTLRLAAYPRDQLAHLVVRGPRWGEVWVSSSQGGFVVPFSSWDAKLRASPGEPVGFFSWFEQWLDSSTHLLTSNASDARQWRADRAEDRRHARVETFERVAEPGGYRVCELGRYQPVHPMSDEADLLAELNLAPADCRVVDCYWLSDEDVHFVQIQSTPHAVGRSAGVYARAVDGRGYNVNIVVVVGEGCDPLTGYAASGTCSSSPSTLARSASLASSITAFRATNPSTSRDVRSG